ncbi:hypothetical protein [Serinicoccus sediminis]|uniref:hypothetical protein n=1 Tax=Serinicoccus sediminis TaxID=2306021 RepID=UPI0013ED3F23|nr:hypothetical protein [Serinicoccus sediminis]
MTDLAPLPTTITGTATVSFINEIIRRMNAAGGTNMPEVPDGSMWGYVRPVLDAIEDRLARWEQLTPEMADVLYAYQQGQDATDTAVAALLGDPSSTRAAIESIANATVSAIAPDGGVQAVGKDEVTRNMTDYGVVGDYAGDFAAATDDTAAINACLAMGGRWLLPGDRQCKITGPLRVTQSHTVVETQAGTTLWVPPGYAGDVVLVGDTTTQIISWKLDGPAAIKEPGKSGGRTTPPGAWTAFHIFGNNTGVTDGRIQWTSWWPDRHVLWEVVGLGWVNVCDVTGPSWYYRTYMECKRNGSTAVGFAGNTVGPVKGQSGNFTEFGIKKLTGRNWSLRDVNLFDIGYNPAAVSLDVDADARSINIQGGLLGAQNVQNRAPAGEVTIQDQFTIAPWSATQPPIGAPEMEVDLSRPVAATWDMRRNAPAWRFPNNGLSGVTFTMRVPPRATKATMVLHVAGVGGTTGKASLAISAAPVAGAGTNLQSTTSTTSRTALVDMVGDDILVEVPLAEYVTSPGQVLGIRVYRIGTDAADTYEGPVVLTAATITYRA